MFYWGNLSSGCDFLHTHRKTHPVEEILLNSYLYLVAPISRAIFLIRHHPIRHDTILKYVLAP